MKHKLIPFSPVLLATLVTALGASCQGLAADRVYEVIHDASVINHWPGTDGSIGSADDVVGATPSPKNFSAPNGEGSLSYNAFDFGNGPEPGLIPSPMNAITFLSGSITIDGAVAQSGGGPLIRGWSFSGTEPFIGHGPYSAQITSVNSGSYNPGTRAMSQNINFIASLVNGTAPAMNFSLSGEAYVVDAANFNTPTGNAYVDNVLVPIARGAGASGLFYARASGIVPASSGGSGGGFPQMPIMAAVVAIERAALPPQQPEFTRISIEPTGMRMEWTVEQGRTYRVEQLDAVGSAWTTLASSQAGPAYIDTRGPVGSARFYRLVVE